MVTDPCFQWDLQSLSFFFNVYSRIHGFFLDGVVSRHLPDVGSTERLFQDIGGLLINSYDCFESPR